MEIPERRELPSGDRRRAPRGGRRAADRPGRHPNLLVADSYEGARIPCAQYLTHFGFRVDQAADGNDALRLIRSAPMHAILVELSLPAVSATRLRELLDEEPRTQSIPLIVMISDFDGRRERLPVRASAVLAKPFALSTMLQEVRRVLRTQAPTSGLQA